METNGTLPMPAGIDWVCVSPKAGAKLIVVAGDELKLLYPQDGADPEEYLSLEFRHFFLQPLDGPQLNGAYCTCGRVLPSASGVEIEPPNA